MLKLELEGLTEDQVLALIPESSILVVYRGSVAHGMHDPQPGSIDDRDIMSVYIGPIEAYLGFGRAGTLEKKFGEFGIWDAVGYELLRFVQLLLKGNPNVLSMLWINPQYILAETVAGRKLRDHRDLFVSKAVYDSFVGYATGQLRRMTHFDGPARRRMQRLEDELTNRKIPFEARPEAFEGDARTLIQSYREMRSKFTSGYMGEKRRKLVEEHGYDTKNAAHMIRLLRMAVEFLNEGTLYVDRSDRDAAQLLAIKRGALTLDEVQAEAERLFLEAGDARDQSPLPEEANRPGAETLCIEMLREHFSV